MRIHGFVAMTLGSAVLTVLAACGVDEAPAPPRAETLDFGKSPSLPVEWDASVCPAQAVPGWQPAQFIHAPLHQNRCQLETIRAFFRACLATGTSEDACDAYRASHDDDCESCLVTSPTSLASANAPPDAAFSGVLAGPLVIEPSSGMAYLNVPGCMQNLDGRPAVAACAAALSAKYQCEMNACLSCTYSDEAQRSCAESSPREACKGHQPGDCLQQLKDDGGIPVWQSCVRGDSWETQFAYLGALFCGP